MFKFNNVTVLSIYGGRYARRAYQFDDFEIFCPCISFVFRGQFFVGIVKYLPRYRRLKVLAVLNIVGTI